MNPADIDDDLRREVAAERAAQGLGPTVTDSVALGRISRIVAAAAAEQELKSA